MITKILTHFILRGSLAGVFLSSLTLPLLGVDQELEGVVDPPQPASSGYCINFNDVPVTEFIRFVSKISGENFIYDHQDLNFNISLSTGKSVGAERVIEALIQLLKIHGKSISRENGYFVIHQGGAQDASSAGKIPNFSNLLADNGPLSSLPRDSENYEFSVYKLQYHEGPEIEDSLKKVAADLRNQPDAPLKLINAIQSLQWVKATNSLLCSADAETLEKLGKLISSLDKPLRQVFIEVLVIETDAKRNSEFGLQWAAGGQYKGRWGFGTGNFAPTRAGGISPFAATMQGVNPATPPTGLGQLPLAPGFDLGVIGDVILHKGKSFLSLGSLVSALQVDGTSTIVLNQKIITQDNKNSTIFVGDNIPFTGSVVQTVGQSQQTTANIEYRDIGVNLSITPRLGEGDVITLDINEEITETLDHEPTPNNASVNGIRTTKTNMATHVHVPDKHFLVLSGMIRNAKANYKSGIPCLGGLPVIGAAFSKTRRNDEKRNVIIFVCPHIIHSFEDYRDLSEVQQELFEKQSSNAKEFEAGLDTVVNGQ